jgi:hypothetical protein
MKRRELAEGRRIVILCEGDTEEIAVRYFIGRQWETDGLRAVGLHTINLAGKLEDVFAYVPRYRRDPRVTAVFTLIDLYGMNRVQYEVYAELDEKVAQARAWLQDNWGETYKDFFFPHLSVHEVEAWLLAEGDCLARRLKDPGTRPNQHAETLNFLDPPSKRVDRLFRDRRGDGYHKINDGTPLFKCLQFQPIYETCRHFREFYDDLTRVGRSLLS